MAISHALVGLSSIVVIFTAASVHAQGMPPEGPVNVTFTATSISPAKPMPVGGGREFDLMNQAMTATNDAGNPILNNMGGRCQFSRLRDPAAKTMELRGFCNYVDKDGDQTFEQCDFLPGQPNKCRITGGTGKFEGLQAELLITVQPMKTNFEGISQVVGYKKGTYKFAKTN